LIVSAILFNEPGGGCGRNGGQNVQKCYRRDAEAGKGSRGLRKRVRGKELELRNKKRRV